MIVSIEGPNGVGKSFTVRKLKESETFKDCFFTRFPGATQFPFTCTIRTLLETYEKELTPLQTLSLLHTDMYYTYSQLTQPLVLTDRSYLSAMVYQQEVLSEQRGSVRDGCAWLIENLPETIVRTVPQVIVLLTGDPVKIYERRHKSAEMIGAKLNKTLTMQQISDIQDRYKYTLQLCSTQLNFELPMTDFMCLNTDELSSEDIITNIETWVKNRI